MKRYIGYIVLVAMTVLWAACTNAPWKRSTKPILIYMSNGSPEEQRLEASQDAQTIDFNNKEYSSYITRTPADSLPRVTDKDGNVYIDNEITLRIAQGDIQLFNQTFTKDSFAPFVSNELLQEAILERIVYNKTTGEGIEYAVSLCYPQTDLYMPVFITVGASGNMSVQTEEIAEGYDYESTTSQM